jgi:hypothetical protein
MVLTALCLLLPGSNASRALRPTTDRCPGFGGIDDPGLPAGAEVVDGFVEIPQPHVGGEGAASLSQPHFADGPGDSGAVHAGPAGQHIVRGPVTEVGQEPVDEHQPMLRTGATARYRRWDESLACCRSRHSRTC